MQAAIRIQTETTKDNGNPTLSSLISTTLLPFTV
jgi:hypothetical protein